MAGCVQSVTKIGIKVAVFFFNAAGQYVETFDSVKDALRWIVDNGLELEEPFRIEL